MHWSCKYIGLSYRKYDCAEFVQYVLEKQFGFKVQFPVPDRKAELRYCAIRESMNKFLESTDAPEEGDCILMSGSRKFNHVGMLVIHNGVKYCMHSSARFGSVVRHRLSDLHLYQLKVEGIYKWQK